MEQGTKILIIFLIFFIFCVIGGGFYYFQIYLPSTQTFSPSSQDSNKPDSSQPVSNTTLPPSTIAPSIIPTTSAPINYVMIGNKQIHDGDTISFKNSDSGKICSDSNGLICNRDNVGPWEQFTVKITDLNKNLIALKSGNSNKWCTDMTGQPDNKVICSADKINGWEQFKVGSFDNKFTLTSGNTNQNCKFRDNKISCPGPSFGNPDEQFIIL